MTQPLVFRADQAVVAFLAQRLVLLAANLIDSVTEILGDVKLVEDDLPGSVGQMRGDRSDVGIPHVHGDSFDPLKLVVSQGRPEAVQAGLTAFFGDVQDVAASRSLTNVR